MLTVERVEFAAAEGEWREMFACCDPAYPFLSPSWQRIWWEEFGNGGGQQTADSGQRTAEREPMLLRVADGGKVRGFVPLMREGDRLTFAGDTSICDYMDVVGAKDGRAELLEALLRSLGEEPWSELVFWAVREDSPTFSGLPTVCASLGLSCETEVEDVCPQLDLPGDWEEYLAGLDKKDRHELRRKMRNLGASGQTAFTRYSSEAEISNRLDRFLEMMRISREAKDTFLTPTMEAYFRELAPAFARLGLLHLAELTVDGRGAAMILAFENASTVFLYNSGYDPEFAKLAAGLVSKALALQDALARGKTMFDFLRGDEEYKRHLGGVPIDVLALTLTGP